MTETLAILLVIVIHAWLLLIGLIRANATLSNLEFRTREPGRRLSEIHHLLENEITPWLEKLLKQILAKLPEPVTSSPAPGILEIKGTYTRIFEGRPYTEEVLLSQPFYCPNKGQSYTLQIMAQQNLDLLEVEVAEPYFITSVKIGAISAAGCNTIATRKFKLTPRTKTIASTLSFTVYKP